MGLLTRGALDSDLSRIASPLRSKSIDRAEIVSDGIGGRIEAEITEPDKEYFQEVVTRTVTSSKGAEIEGNLISLNKEKNRGTFRLLDGTSVPYEYHGRDPYSFHNDFARRGLVRVTCDTDFDQNLKPSRISIVRVEHLQGNLPLQPENSGSGGRPGNQ